MKTLMKVNILVDEAEPKKAVVLARETLEKVFRHHEFQVVEAVRTTREELKPVVADIY